MRIPMDLIMPEQEMILEVEEKISVSSILLAAGIIIIAVALIANVIKRKK